MPRPAGTVFVLALVTASALRAGWLEARWAAHDGEARELLHLAETLDDRDRLLVARAGSPTDVLLHSHSASHLARDVGLFLPEIFSGGNAVRARPAYRLRDNFQTFPVPVASVVDEARAPRSPDPERLPYAELYWADWPAFYTHVLVLGRAGQAFPEVPELGRLIRRGSFFALYQTAAE